MNNKIFIKRLSEKTGLTQKQVASLSEKVFETICRRVNDGDSVMVSNFGTFEVKKQEKRTIVNPGTRQRMVVPEKLKMVFKAATNLKLNNSTTESL